jgi:hypothetical protein
MPKLLLIPLTGGPHLHLPAKRNHNIQVWNILAAISRLGLLHLLDHIHTLHYLAKNNVFVVEEGCWDCGDEELGTVTIFTSVL